jgi:drug/metabolite transporter (DMT)-like permease
MNFFIPTLAAILQSGSSVLDKIILSQNGVRYRAYLAISFPLIFFINFGIYTIFRPSIPLEQFTGISLGLLALSIASIIFSNLIYYKALESDQLQEIQIISLLPTIPIILFSSFIFSDERNPLIIFAALAASLAIIWSHWERRHFQIVKNTASLLWWSLLIYPIGAALSKELLKTWDPISLELVRNGIIAIFFSPLIARHYQSISHKALALLVLTNALTEIAWILYYFSYQLSGIVYTVLLFSLQPLLTYFGSLFFLKESFQRKKFIAFFIVLISVIAAQITR